jgi:hypothetical protein
MVGFLALIKLYVEKWFSLINYCNSDRFDKDIFQIYHDQYRDAWDALDYQLQGEVCWQIAERHKLLAAGSATMILP